MDPISFGSSWRDKVLAADPYYPSAVRSSLGAIFTQGIVRAGLEDLAVWARRQGYAVVGTSPHNSVDYRSVQYQQRTVLFMGNERVGLTDEQQSVCDVMVTIPMVGHVDSHNVAVAASVMLYEMLGQRERGATADPARLNTLRYG